MSTQEKINQILGENKATQTKDIAKAKEIWQFVKSSLFRG